MVDILIEPKRRGGFRKPLSTRAFIIDHLTAIGEDHPSSIHQAYKAKLRELAEAKPLPIHRGRGRQPTRHLHYKAATYYSFTRELRAMEREGSIKKSGRTEVSDSVHTEHWPNKPTREYYQLS
jgi:hypothetical protein